jgi:hypothetical protein
MGLNVVGAVCATAIALANETPTATAKAAPAHFIQGLLIVLISPLLFLFTANQSTFVAAA